MSSSPNHDHLSHLKIPLEDILSATNNFAEDKFAGTGGFGNHYLGQLLWSDEVIDIHAQRWNKEWDEKEQQFWMEISLLSSLKHKNLVSLVGFCDENDEKIIIIKLETMCSLDNYFSDTMMLTWVRRLEICVGLAHALSSIHYDEHRHFSVIHGNINSDTILLNDNFEPKLSEFRLSMKIEASQRHHSFRVDKVWDMEGYTDPTYIETKIVSHKSDIYSFGIVMFELVCGRKAVINDDQDNKYLAPTAIIHYREETLEDIVDWNLWKQMDPQSFEVFVEIAYDCLNEEQSQRPNINEIVTKLEKALELARVNQPMTSLPSNEFAHLRITLENILSATNNFAQENVVRMSGFSKDYKGHIFWSGELIHITARRLNKEMNDREQLLWMEISMLSTLKHKNLVSLIGFCDENDEKIIIIRNETRGMLFEYISNPMLTWVRRLKICVGIAHALSYVHYDESRDFSVIHRLIDSSRVLLNDEWEPKLCDFERSMKIKGSQRHHSFHTIRLDYVNGYGDPTYIETKSVNHKSDVYSFGIVLFELLCGRRSIIDTDNNKYLASLAITHYKEKRLNEIINWDLWEQMDSRSFHMFTEIAYECLNEERSQRPDIDEIVTRLEKALEHQNAMLSLRNNEFAHLQVPLENILSTTNNFAQENVTCNGEFATEYKGQLLWSGELINITARRLNKDMKDGGEQQFWMEISMLFTLKHKNMVSLVGFCDKNDEKIIIMSREMRGSLNNYLSDPMLLTWVRRLEISVGIAHALSYIHYDEQRDFSIIHRNINSSTVLINDDWEPKLSNFEHSMKIKASQRHHSFNNFGCTYTLGYVDSTFLKAYTVNHKSDMYSFGIILFELLCGRESIIDTDSNKYLTPLALTHYREKRLDEIIDWDLWKQMDTQSFDIFSETAYDCLNEGRSQRPNIDEIATRLEKALELELEHQKAIMALPSNKFAHLKVPLENILSATNNFAQENVIITSEFAKDYKGQLLWSSELIHITARRLNKERNDREQLFWMEISMLSTLKHKNLVSLVGFCDENDEKIIINRNVPDRGMLVDHLYDPVLTWVQRLEICVGVAHALSYIHYDEPRDFSVIHRAIDGSKVLLNDDWEPKLLGFEQSMKIKASQRNHTFHTNTVNGVNGYVDPTYIETKRVSHKSDMYSFGIVLLEVLCGRESIIHSDTNKDLVPLAATHYREKRLDEIIDWDLWKQMDSQSFNIFAEIAYDCLNEECSQRPNIDEIVPKLEKALKLACENRPIMSKEFAHLKVPLENILSATNNFTQENVIRDSGFAMEYKGQLLLSGELIDITAKRFNKERNDREQLFWVEISMLSTLKHENLVSLVGFCDENDEKIIIIKRETMGMLIEYLSDPMLLTWVRRLEICVGVAHALSYIHYDELRDFSVIHRLISSDRVLLNDGWEPKLCDFVWSMKIKASQRHRSFYTPFKSVNGYADPTYLETNRVSHKSDMYSFGIVLFELLCGRKSIIDDKDDNHLAMLAITHYREKKLDNIIDTDLWKQIDLHSFNMFAEIAYECLDKERSRRPNIDDIVPRLEKALESARENKPIHSAPNHLAHLRIPFEDIESATNFFAKENVIGIDGSGKRSKGKLSWSGELIDIIAWRLSSKEWDEKEQQFWTEISMLSSLKHKNIDSIVGFCNEVGAETIIYKHESRGRLENYLSDPILLTWVKRLETCVGLAHALSYIHYDETRNFSVIHQNISSYTVRLNNDWEPKLSEFQHSMKVKASERHNSFHTNSVGSRKGYTDPTCLETNIGNHKSDIYSFGIILFELLCGRKSISDDQDNKYLAPVAIFHYREKILDGIIDHDLWKQMNPRSFSIFSKTAYQCLNEERSQHPKIDEIVTRLEKALELQLEHENVVHLVAAAEVEGISSDHEKGSVTYVSSSSESPVSNKTKSFPKDVSHLKLSFQELQSATNNFDKENIHNENGWICKGRLLRSGQFIDIVGKGYQSDSEKDDSKMFRVELSMLSSLKHKNLVSLIGFMDEAGVGAKGIIYKREANGSLEKYLGDETLTWMQRLKICTDVANALSYLHYDVGRDFSVIHCNIRSSKILLDDKWEPKLSGFELSLKNTVARRLRLLLTRDIVKNAYLDPKYNKTGGVTHKSDVYSFGVVLFEVLCGKSANDDKDEDEDEDELREGLLSQLHKSHLDEMIMPQLRKQMDPESFIIFSETANWCIKEDRADRPYIDQVVKRLEKALELQWKHENPIQLKGKNLEHLKISLSIINQATNNFDEAYCIGSGGFGKVYKADLEHFNSSNSSSKEGVDECDLPRKRSTVAIKRINNQEGGQGFIAEIETLTSCKHENIISLLGFCYEGNGTMILVYEHASKGSLENYLGSSDKMANLNWLQRLNICLDIAHGLSYIHNNTDHGKQKMIHRDIKSDNILLGDNWKAKIADFGLSKFHPVDQSASTIYTNMIAGTKTYLDPEYLEYGRLNKKSDIYSFGVVLLEILTGSLAYDPVYTKVNEKGIAPVARDHFEKGTIMHIVDHKIKEESDEHVFSLSKGPNKKSLDIFLEIAFRCVAESQAQRPTIEVVINELKKALDSQENHKDNLKLSLEDIKSATKDFSQDNIIGHGDSGNVYKGATHNTHGDNIIAAKRLDKKSGQGDAEVLTEVAAAKFMAELDILMEYKHINVIGLVGYCDEEDENVVVYEYASRGSLDKYLSDNSLTWVMRLKICIDIALGLEFLHGSVSSSGMVIHRDISSSNILLFDDWKAKITGFGLSLVCPTNHNAVDYVIDNVTGTIGYRDPLHSKTGFLTKESDIFSLGAVLFDILCGKLSSEKLDDEYLYLPFLAKHHYHEGKLDKLVLEGIKEQIVPQSYITFTRIAFQCLYHRRERRPTAAEVVIQLKKSLEFQEDHEKWEPKLPKDYKDIIHMSRCPEFYSTIKKEELYNIFSKGILLEQDKLLLSFVGNGERNEMVSATMFSYINSCPHELKYLQESRFEKVVEISDITSLFIEIKTRAQFLSPNVVYDVYFVFKFCESRNFPSKPMYVDLNYTKGHESLNAYFATWRDDGWMMIELYRFLNKNKDVVFEFLLECFSSFHCGDGTIYVEGIEFRAIENVS